MEPHFSTVARKIPWMEESGRLQSMGLLRVRHDWVTSLSLSTFMHWRRKWQPTPVFVLGESQGWGEPGGLPSTGSHRVGHDWSDLAAAVTLNRDSLQGLMLSTTALFTDLLDEGGLLSFFKKPFYSVLEYCILANNVVIVSGEQRRD